MSGSTTEVPIPFPDTRALEQLLGGLTGRRPVTRPSKLASVAGNGRLPWFAGLYTEDGHEEPCATVVVDYAVAHGSTAAMMETPAALVLEEEKAGRVNPLLRPALQEILNVCASLLNASGSPHLRLTRVLEWRSAPPDEVQVLMAAQGRRLQVEAAFAPCRAGHIFIRRLAGS